jgi:uncharacterized protein (DUF4415 family)
MLIDTSLPPPRQPKVSVHLRLDADVAAWLRGQVGYNELVRVVLRRVMEAHLKTASEG